MFKGKALSIKEGIKRFVERINNKAMEFKVYRTWEWENATKMKFDSLEELLEFTKQKQQEKDGVEGLIISWNENEKIWEAEIYDSYRE